MDAVLDTIAGLPVHPLVVHAVVVLVPIAAIAAIAMAIRPQFSRRFGVAVVVLAVIAAVTSFIAKASGDRLAARLGFEPQPHTDLGNQLPIFVTVFALLLLIFWLFDRGVPGNRRRPTWLKVLAVAVVIAAVLATWWTFRVGHSGAESVWAPKVSVNR
jgi:Mn2+/Fe2+ NRAMP family transporter